MIEAKNLIKRYGANEALKGVSFNFEPGRIYGFLGPNGAGKSTTMNIITGCLAASEGEVKINGYDIFEDAAEAKKCIGYLPEQPPLYFDMTPYEYLMYVGRAKGLKREKLNASVEDVIDKTDIGDVRDRLIKNLSKGYKQRVGIAQAILGDPEIIILDEPTVGLDPIQIIEIRSLIKELGEKHTVILSSHILSEISEVCDYVIIISKGEIVASDTIDNLTTMFKGTAFVDIDARGGEEQVRDAVDGVEGVKTFDISEQENGVTHVRIETDREKDIRDELFFRFCDIRVPIIGMAYEETTLEKIFLSLTEEADPQMSDSGSGDMDAPVGDDISDSEDSSGESNEQADEESYQDVPEDEDENSDNDDYKPLFGGQN